MKTEAEIRAHMERLRSALTILDKMVDDAAVKPPETCAPEMQAEDVSNQINALRWVLGEELETEPPVKRCETFGVLPLDWTMKRCCCEQCNKISSLLRQALKDHEGDCPGHP